MKNLDLLPASPETRERLVRMADLHRMYGGPIFDIGAVVGNHVLVLITTRNNSLSHREIIAQGNELFVGELPSFTIHYAINTPYKTHVPTYDTKHVFRIDDPPLLATVTRSNEGNLTASGRSYEVRIVAGTHESVQAVQLFEWLQASIEQEGVRYDVQELFDQRAVVSTTEILDDLFKRVPLPQGLEAYRDSYEQESLDVGTTAQIIESYTDYETLLICLQPSHAVTHS